MYVKVRVTAAAKKEEVAVVSEHRFAISVKQKPAENSANTRVIELVARHYGVPVEKVRIVRGHHAPSKMLLVDALKSGM